MSLEELGWLSLVLKITIGTKTAIVVKVEANDAAPDLCARRRIAAWRTGVPDFISRWR